MTDTIADASRRRALVEAHYAVENRHDLEAIMHTFSARGVMLYNHAPFTDAASISAAHAYIGCSAAGAFAALRTVIDHHHLTADEIVVEGRLSGRHVGEFQGFAPSGRDIELPFVAFYRFDGDGKLTSERVVMNLGPLAELGD